MTLPDGVGEIVINAMTCFEASNMSNGSLDIQESATIIICIITSPDSVGFLRIVKKYKVNQLKDNFEIVIRNILM